MMQKLLLFALPMFLAGCQEEDHEYIRRVEDHFGRIITEGVDQYGERSTPVWMASLDPSTGRYPTVDTRPDHIPARVYLDRSVDAPRGATLYWDFPSVAATFELSAVTGDTDYRDAAEKYVQFIMSNCRASNGIILWGNHYYYDAFADRCVRFKSSETPEAVDFSFERGDLHEMRPHAPPWDILWDIDPAAVQRHIITTVERHLVDPATGEFNRHADSERGYAFLEYGGILACTLAWLYRQTGEEELLKKADRIIEYSIGHRNEQTGLVENSPTQDRWDKYASTTEVGLWGNYVVKAALLAPGEYAQKWLASVDTVLSAWLRFGFDVRAGQYFGGLQVATGQPFIPDPEYPYQPGYHAQVWNPLFPTHNYPMQFAEVCLQMHARTGKPAYETACHRWVQHIVTQTDGRTSSQLLYAENYARIIHFLMRYDNAFDAIDVSEMIDELIHESVFQLYMEREKLFIGHTGEQRYDAVDGVGLLSLVYLWYDHGTRPETCTYFF